MTQGILNEPVQRAAPTRQPEKKKHFKVVFFLAGIAFICLAAAGIIARNATNSSLEQRSTDAAKVVVNIVHPQKAATTVPVQLPGETRAFTEAPIFAQTSGYLKKWYFDIGSKVKAGDILADIDTPEVDQQLEQSRATLKNAQAQLELSQSNYKRNQDLFNRKVIASQDFDSSTSDFRVKQATAVADQADVSRLEALEGFKQVKAPFDGIITVRSTDIGAFVPSGSGTQLFRIAQISPLRIYVNVPQAFSQYVKEGTEADLMIPEIRGKKFPAHVTRTAGVIDPASRTLLTELQVPNETDEVFPGAYGQVLLKLNAESKTVVVPSNTLLFRADGTTVGVVKQDGTVELRKIVIGRDLGASLEIVDGLNVDDAVIINPSDGLAAGQAVSIAEPKKPEQNKPEQNSKAKS
jgi:RND family efflux transporter MFP subunit